MSYTHFRGRYRKGGKRKTYLAASEPRHEVSANVIKGREAGKDLIRRVHLGKAGVKKKSRRIEEPSKGAKCNVGVGTGEGGVRGISKKGKKESRTGG